MEKIDSMFADAMGNTLSNIADYHSMKTQVFDIQKDAVFSDFSGDKIGSLKGTIDDIETLIKQREQLNKEIFNDLIKIKVEMDNFMNSLPTPTTFNPVIVTEQLKMRQKQIDIDEMRVKEKVDSWRDVAELKKELRERIKEFKERENRASVLDKIFEE